MLAKVALVRLHTSMSAQMAAQTTFDVEPGRTVRTSEWFIAGMHADVNFQFGLAYKFHITIWTFFVVIHCSDSSLLHWHEDLALVARNSYRHD